MLFLNSTREMHRLVECQVVVLGKCTVGYPAALGLDRRGAVAPLIPAVL